MIGKDVERALRALNEKAVIKQRAENYLWYGLSPILIGGVWGCFWYLCPYFFPGLWQMLPTASLVLQSLGVAKTVPEAAALGGWIVGSLMVGSLGLAVYNFLLASRQDLHKLDLTDEQRRLLGLDPLRKKPFVPLIVSRPPPRYEVPPAGPPPTPSTPVPDLTVRSPWSDLTPIGPMLGQVDPLRDRVGQLGASARRAGGGYSTQRPVSFGGSADKKMKDLLEDYRNDLQSPSAEQQGYQLPSISPSIGKAGQYRESPVGQRFPGSTHGGSPTVQMDKRDWLNSLTRMGLTSEDQLSRYTDNMREFLCTQIREVLARYERAFLALEQHVPREILMRNTRNLDALLPQVADQQGFFMRMHEFKAAARVIEEGYNWKDSYEYVIRRMVTLAQDAFMSAFDWKTGGVLRDKNVTVQTPTDADIVMHVFLSYLDALTEHRNAEQDQPFINQHFLQVKPDEECPSVRGRDLIVRQASSPPHFDVVEHGAMHRVQHSKHNAFHAMVIFLFLARKNRWLPLHNDGYKRMLQAVFGSVHPPQAPPTPPLAGTPQGGRRISF